MAPCDPVPPDLAALHERCPSSSGWTVLRTLGPGRDGDALDGALCFGWIDGQRRAYDERSFLQRYSPRRKASPWSQVNVAKVEALIADGRMRSAGLAEVEAATTDGRWGGAYEPQRTAKVPADLAEALASNPAANAAFDRLEKSERYAVMLPLLRATTPESRAKSLARAIDRLVP